MLENPSYFIENLTRGTMLATCATVAGTSSERRQGLLQSETLRPGEALWIAPCEAIHTAGMKWPIDVVFIDRNYRVRKVRVDVRPWRIAVCWAAASVIELAAGSVQLSGTEEGDVLAFRAG